jgi:excinuclease UvrABC nuclease subunit
MDHSSLLDQIDRFPQAPGVYLMQNGKGTIVYVGKAKHLRNRVRQYFSQSGDPRYHIRLGLRTVKGIDFIVTNTEKEALILENTLIKKHRPRFNISLRDDKNHVHLRLDPKQSSKHSILVHTRLARQCERRCASSIVLSPFVPVRTASSTAAHAPACITKLLSASAPAYLVIPPRRRMRNWYGKSFYICGVVATKSSKRLKPR